MQSPEQPISTLHPPAIPIPPTHEIRVFAGLRDGLARDRVIFSFPGSVLPQDRTTRVLKTALAASYPDLAVLIKASRLAVNHTFVDDDASLELAFAPGVEIALIPPVSGG